MAKTSKLVKHAHNLRHGHPTKIKNRCQICGRPRSYIRLFGVCRICFRRLAHQGELPGVVKASK